jgi:signal transduction histidine kinase
MKLEDEILKQDRLKAVATLAAGMAHEIKNPLTSIRTFAEYLPEKYADPEFRGKFKKIVVDEVDRVNSIVQQLLEFSKPKEPELKPVSIVDILDDTLGLITSKLLDHKIALSREYQASPQILADRNQLKQAFLNLFLNSIQAMPGGGTLTVKTTLTGNNRLLVAISDTGTGIPKESLPHIFDPFYTTKESGTGLGLSIVHGIVLKHKGKIRVESGSGGTTISVALKSQS